MEPQGRGLTSIRYAVPSVPTRYSTIASPSQFIAASRRSPASISAGSGATLTRRQLPEPVGFVSRIRWSWKRARIFPWCLRKRSEEHTSELQSRGHLVCRLLLEKKKNRQTYRTTYST